MSAQKMDLQKQKQDYGGVLETNERSRLIILFVVALIVLAASVFYQQGILLTFVGALLLFGIAIIVFLIVRSAFLKIMSIMGFYKPDNKRNEFRRTNDGELEFGERKNRDYQHQYFDHSRNLMEFSGSKQFRNVFIKQESDDPDYSFLQNRAFNWRPREARDEDEYEWQDWDHQPYSRYDRQTRSYQHINDQDIRSRSLRQTRNQNYLGEPFRLGLRRGEIPERRDWSKYDKFTGERLEPLYQNRFGSNLSTIQREHTTARKFNLWKNTMQPRESWEMARVEKQNGQDRILTKRSRDKKRIQEFQTSYDNSVYRVQPLWDKKGDWIQMSRQHGLLVPAFKQFKLSEDKPINMMYYIREKVSFNMQAEKKKQDILLQKIDTLAIELFGDKIIVKNDQYQIENLKRKVHKLQNGETIEMSAGGRKQFTKIEFKSKVSELSKLLLQVKENLLGNSKKKTLLYYMKYAQQHYMLESKLVLVEFQGTNASFCSRKNSKGEVEIAYDTVSEFCYVLPQQKNHSLNIEETILLIILMNMNGRTVSFRSELTALLQA